MGLHQKGHVANIDAGGANYHSYSTGPDGLRVRKAANDGSVTEYFHFNGATISEWNSLSDWSDYIYANGKRIARADSYEDRMLFQGTNCSSCGSLSSVATMHSGSGAALQGYVIQSGDKPMVRQWSGVSGGVGIVFTQGATWNDSQTPHLLDQDSQDGAVDTMTGAWHYRQFNLSQYVGNHQLGGGDHAEQPSRRMEHLLPGFRAAGRQGRGAQDLLAG